MKETFQMAWSEPRDPFSMTDYEADLALEYEMGAFAAGVAANRPDRENKG